MPTKLTFSGTITESIEVAYNDLELSVDTIKYNGVTNTMLYDDDGLVEQITRDNGETISFDRVDDGTGFANATGRVESMTYGALTLTPAYSMFGETEGMNFDVNSVDAAEWSLSFDRFGDIVSKSEMVNGGTDNYVYTYDALGQLMTVTLNGSVTEAYAEFDGGGNALQSYDANGNRLYSDVNGEAREYVYDDDDRLEGYDSDADGNLDGALDVEYEYDADGYLTSMTDGSGTTYYDYSSRGELLSATLPDATVIEYAHDVSGNPIERRVDSVLTHRYFWGSKTQLLAYWEYNASGTEIHETFIDPGNGITRDGTKYFLAHDQVGSVRAVINTSGTIVKVIDYDSFGNILNDTNPSFYMPLGFARGFMDSDTGFVRFGYRDYDPNTGRWTAKDPIFFDGGQANLYVYVGNSPVMYTDGSGLVRDMESVMREVEAMWEAERQAGFEPQNPAHAALESLAVDAAAIGVSFLAGGLVIRGVVATGRGIVSVCRLPATVTHFTTAEGAAGIAVDGVIRPGAGLQLFGKGVYSTSVGRPFNPFVPKNATVPITIPTPPGTKVMIPKLVYKTGGNVMVP